MNRLRYLALGDSYTIGEQVEPALNFPNQTVKLLEEKYNIPVDTPDIIAVTGWTTDELLEAIKQKNPDNNYDIVTLLIGVNNQYRNRSLPNYREEFLQLLKKAITFAQNKPENVWVLSIPDWGRTPFAKEKDAQLITQQIDAFNFVNRFYSEQAKTNYLSITHSTRQHNHKDYLTEDLLHYNESEYAIWANRLAQDIARRINSQ